MAVGVDWQLRLLLDGFDGRMHQGHRLHLCCSLDRRPSVDLGAGPGLAGTKYCLDCRLLHGTPAGVGCSQSSGRCMGRRGLRGVCGGVKVSGCLQVVGLGCLQQPWIMKSLIHRVAIVRVFCQHPEYAGPHAIRGSTQLQHVPDLIIAVECAVVYCSAAQQLADTNKLYTSRLDCMRTKRFKTYRQTYTHTLIHSKAAAVNTKLMDMDPNISGHTMRYQNTVQQLTNSKVHIILIKTGAAACNSLTRACRAAKHVGELMEKEAALELKQEVPKSDLNGAQPVTMK